MEGVATCTDDGCTMGMCYFNHTLNKKTVHNQKRHCPRMPGPKVILHVSKIVSFLDVFLTINLSLHRCYPWISVWSLCNSGCFQLSTCYGTCPTGAWNYSGHVLSTRRESYLCWWVEILQKISKLWKSQRLAVCLTVYLPLGGKCEIKVGLLGDKWIQVSKGFVGIFRLEVVMKHFFQFKLSLFKSFLKVE